MKFLKNIALGALAYTVGLTSMNAQEAKKIEVSVDSTQYQKALAETGHDEIIYLKPVVEHVINERGEEYNRQNIRAVTRELLDCLPIEAKGKVHSIESIGINENDDGSKKATLYMSQAYASKPMDAEFQNSKKVTDSDICDAILNQEIEFKFTNCLEDCLTDSDKKNQRAPWDFWSNFLLWGGLFTGNSTGGTTSGFGGINVPISPRSNIRVGAGYGIVAEETVEDRKVLTSITTNGGRTFLEVEYTNGTYSLRPIGSLGYAYDIIENNDVSVTLGLGAVVYGLNSSNQIELVEEAFFDANNNGDLEPEEFIGNGVNEERFTPADPQFEVKVGLDGNISLRAKKFPVGITVGGNYVPNALPSFDAENNLQFEDVRSLYLGVQIPIKSYK